MSNKISVTTLMIMNVIAVLSLRGLPAEAFYGMSSIFYYLFAAIFFLIPIALVAAELTTGWPESGGIFRWIGEAFGYKMALLGVILIWVQIIVWFPTALIFGSVSLAYVNSDPIAAKELASNKFFILSVVLIIYWSATFLAMRGTQMFSKISKYCGLIGTIIPAIILITLSFSYVFIADNKPQIDISFKAIFPDFTNFNNIVLAASIFLFYAGMEMNSLHVKRIDNPKKNYPIAVILASIIVVIFFVLGTLSIAFVIPKDELNLTQSLLITFNTLFKWANISWLSPIIAICLAVGVLAGIITWVAGPSTAVLTVAKAGYLPRWWQHTNDRGMASHILIAQAIMITLLSVLFVILPSVQAVYQILTQLSVIVYLIMYLEMFSAAIYLRYSQPSKERTYKIPFGNFGMWCVAGSGFIASLIALVFSFIPPSQINIGSKSLYFGILITLTIIVCIIPFVICKIKKPHWRDENSDFVPFTWELDK